MAIRLAIKIRIERGKGTMEMNTNDSFGQWGILELMGHVKLAGLVSEEVTTANENWAK